MDAAAPPPRRPLDLRLGDLRALTATAVASATSDGIDAAVARAPFGAYLFAPDDPHSELARHVERTVFLETFGNTPELLAAEYGPYEPASGFICVIDHRRRLPVGMARILVPGPARCKTFDDIEAVWGRPLDEVFAASKVAPQPERTWDIATLAVAEGYRQGIVSQALFRAISRGAVRNGMGWIVATLDLLVLRLIQSRIGRPFHRFRGLAPRRYLDSPASVPVWLEGAEYRPRLEATWPELAELVFAPDADPAVADAAWDRQPAVFAGLPAVAGVEVAAGVDVRDQATVADVVR